MDILIIEDEELASEKLKMLLQEIDPAHRVLATLDSVADSVRWLSMNQADLILLDIHLSDDLSFKIFEQIQVDTPIIFTTAYDEFAIKAFEQNSIAYLLKPVGIGELRRGLEKYQKLAGNSPIKTQEFQELLSHFQRDVIKRVIVSFGGKMRAIDTKDIALFYSAEKVTYLLTFSGTRYVVDDSLDQTESSLNPREFFRVNRRYLVQFSAIQEVLQYSSRKLKLELAVDHQEVVTVPTEKITKFKRWFAGN